MPRKKLVELPDVPQNVIDKLRQTLSGGANHRLREPVPETPTEGAEKPDEDETES